MIFTNDNYRIFLMLARGLYIVFVKLITLQFRTICAIVQEFWANKQEEMEEEMKSGRQNCPDVNDIPVTIENEHTCKIGKYSTIF